MKILITFALENEFAPWREMRAFRPARWGCANVHAAEFDGTQVGVLLTGVGRCHTEKRLAEVGSEAYKSIDFVISSGLAGGLRPEHKIGQVLAAKRVLAKDMDAPVPSSARLISLASECGAAVVDVFFSADRVATSTDEKRALGAVADAVEMESFEVLCRAADSGIPAIAVRAVSDTLEEGLPVDTNRIFTADGEVSIPRILREVARRPQSIPGFVRLGRQSRVATESLAHFLESYVQKLTRVAGAVETEAVVMHG